MQQYRHHSSFLSYRLDVGSNMLSTKQSTRGPLFIQATAQPANCCFGCLFMLVFRVLTQMVPQLSVLCLWLPFDSYEGSSAVYKEISSIRVPLLMSAHPSKVVGIHEVYLLLNRRQLLDVSSSTFYGWQLNDYT